MLPNLTATAEASSRSMCLLADVKTELNISGSGDDTKISTLIRAASAMIEKELGREPWLQTYSEKRPGQGGRYLYLSRFPAKGEPTTVTFGTGSSPDTIDSDTYGIAGRARDRIYRADGWSQTAIEEDQQIHSSQALPYNLAYPAGWVMPDQVSTAWATGTAYAVGDWVQDAADLDYPLIFECTTAGTSHASTTPTWSGATADGDTITDESVTWTARRQLLPDALELACKMLATEWFAGFAPANVSYEALESWSIRYTENQQALSSSVKALVVPYR